MMRLRGRRANAGGFTFVDNVMALFVVGLFFGSLYQLNSQCLYLVSAGRDATAANQAGQARMDQLRNSKWSQATSPTYVTSLMNTASIPSLFLQNKATEKVTVSYYSPPLAAGAATPASTPATFVVTRTPGGTASVSPSTYPPARGTAVSTGDAVRIDVEYDWTTSAGNQAHSAVVSTVLGENSH